MVYGASTEHSGYAQIRDAANQLVLISSRRYKALKSIIPRQIEDRAWLH